MKEGDVMLHLSYKAQKRILIFGFLAIPTALLITFSFVPLGNLVYFSFLKWDGLSKNKTFIGLDNYVRLFTNPEYFEVFKVSLYYLVGSFIQMALALYFATILTFKVKGKNFFKGVLFFPNLLNGVAISFIFLYFFKGEGTLDTVLRLIGLESWIQKWLLNVNLVNISMAFTSVWRYMGFNFIVFLGAIQSISSEIYEAADIDGATKWHKFIYIIWPSIMKIIELNLILSISGAISAFEIPYVMLGGSNGTRTFVIQVVELAFKNNKVGLASAMAIVLLLIVLAVTGIQKVYFGLKKEEV